jgi:hypothetical protein
MGEARKRAAYNAEHFVDFDFNAPEYEMNEIELENLGEDPRVGATRSIINACLTAKFPQGADRTSGKQLVVWSRAMRRSQESREYKVRMGKGSYDFMHRIVCDENLKLAWQLVPWREVLADYMDSLKAFQIEEPTMGDPEKSSEVV